MNTQLIQQSILPWIGKTGKMLHVYMAEKFKEHHHELTFQQALILKILYDEDGQPQQNLALVTDRHKASLTRIIGSMERKNLVARIPDTSDGRVNRIFLTTKGRKYYQSMLPIIEEAIHEIHESLDASEVAQLIKTLKKVQHNIHKKL